MNLMFSLVIPCYNSFKNMKKCLHSLESQTYKNFEVIFVDDMSTDNTYECLKNYQSQSQYQCNILRCNKNGGPGAARNLGMSVSLGNYIVFLDSDDYLDMKALEIISQYIEGYDCILFDYYKVHTESKLKCNTVYRQAEGKVRNSDALKFSSSSVCCKCYSREILLVNQILFPNLIRAEDLVFNKIALSKCKKIIYIKEPLYYYIANDGSIMNTLSNIIINNEINAFNIIKDKISTEFAAELNHIYSEEVIFTTLQNMILLKYSKQEISEMIICLLNNNSEWINNLDRTNYNLYHYLFLKNVIKGRIGILYLLVFFKSIIKNRI